MVQYLELIYLDCTKALLLGLYSPPQVMERADTAGLHSEPASAFLSQCVYKPAQQGETGETQKIMFHQQMPGSTI